MSYENLDALSSEALRHLISSHDFDELGNGDAVFRDVDVTFQSTTKVENTITDMWFSRTTQEFGKIRFDEQPQDDFDTDNVHIEFDANWSNVTYRWIDGVFQINGSSPRFGNYSLKVFLINGQVNNVD